MTTLTPFAPFLDTFIESDERISSEIRSFVSILKTFPKCDEQGNKIRDKIWLEGVLPFLTGESCPWIAESADKGAESGIEVVTKDKKNVEEGEVQQREGHAELGQPREFSSTLNILGEINARPSSSMERMSITGGVRFGKIYLQFTLLAIGRREEEEENRKKRDLGLGFYCIMARKNKELEEDNKDRGDTRERGVGVSTLAYRPPHGLGRRRGMGRKAIGH
jgi:hypothetical protein